MRKICPSAVIAVTGCFPQAFREKAEEITEVDIITGTKNKLELSNLVKQFLSNRKRIIQISEYDKNDGFDKMQNLSYENHTRAFVKIQDGCNQFCSYCIIPYARGRIRSKPLEDLREEVTQLAQNGYKEIVLVGINLSFYGKELSSPLSLASAVEECEKIEGISRIRLGSLEPEMLSDNEISRLKKCSKFCAQFHLSLQSGCDNTLKAMNRHYNSDEYYSLVKKLRDAFDDCSITTDVMVGFPGETEADFLSSVEFVKKCGFGKVHVFPYSIRKGTRAAEFPNQISSSEKTRRAALMGEAARENQNLFLRSQIGRVYPVLFERENCTEFHQGYTPNYTLVKISRENTSKSLHRQIFYVKITEVCSDFCLGEIV